jgi:integrase
MKTTITQKKKWEAKVFRRVESDNPDGIYHYKPMYQGRRETFSTGTPVKAIAGVVARQIYMYLRANGWDATLEKYSHKKKEPGPVTTLGEFIARVESTFDGQRRTIVDYVSNLRKVAAEIAGIIRSQKTKHDYRSAGREAWLAKVDRLALEAIKREKIEAWRVAYVAAAGDDLNQIRARKTTCNSILRECAALFAAERLERAGLSSLANPFQKIKPFPAADMRYQGGTDPEKIFKAALVEMAQEPELLKALTLGLCCGLRRNEIDKLEWNAFDFEQSLIRIAPTAVLHIKGKRIGEVAVEPEIMALFRGWFAKRTGSFILESEVEARPRSNYSHYRAQKTFDRLTSWLRRQGLTSHTPVHELRKMFGSRVYLSYDLLAASLALRHSNVATTAGHYLTKRPRVTAGFAALLTPENVVAIPSDNSEQNDLHLSEHSG